MKRFKKLRYFVITHLKVRKIIKESQYVKKLVSIQDISFFSNLNPR